MDTVYLNGDYLNRQDAKLSIFDRSTLFGDALYEVIPSYNSQLLGEQAHLDRLHQGQQAVQIPPPLNHQQWQEIFNQLLDRNSARDGHAMIYCQVSRGVEPKRRHAWCENTKPCVFAWIDALPAIDDQAYSQGKKAISLPDIRRQTCYIKSTSLQVNTLMQHQAHSEGAVEAILFRDDLLTEGSCSNVFIVKNNEILTPIANELILNGVTRRLVIALAKQNKLTINECDIRRDQVFSADEVWLTSSTKEVCPLRQIDNHAINGGKTGPVWAQMIQWYRNQIDKY